MISNETLMTIAAYIDVFTNVLTIFLSILTGYLIVAYLIGKKLSAFEVFLVNSLFVTFEFLMILGMAMATETLTSLQDWEFSLSGSPGMYFLFFVVFPASILGAMLFMHRQRNPRLD